MSAKKASIQQATEFTQQNLNVAARSVSAQKLSRMTLPEIDAVVQLVSKMVPAGNVPGMILSGLARLPGRRIPVQKLQQDVTALFSGVEQILDKAVYGAFFAGPAAILWGYQNLLKLAGKDPESAFPEGAWQFYVDYALREDTARHTNETDGFDSILKFHHIQLNKIDRLTAWYMAAVTCLHQYPALLENEWRERVSISLLEAVLSSASLETQKAKKMLRDWELKRPYRRNDDGAQYDYPAYRSVAFDRFLNEKMETIPEKLHKAWQDSFDAVQQDLAAYQRQMSIVAYLEPGPYGETRVPFDLADAKIGIIHNGGYYLLPVCEESTGSPLDVLTAREQIAALMEAAPEPSQVSSLARIQRSALGGLRSKLNPALFNDLDNLKFAPILISTDVRSRDLPLSELRQTERGVGSHAMTIFDTGETVVFDQSHIFFDGAWGTALAEIMTNEALSWARYLSMLPSPAPAQSKVYTSLKLQLDPQDLELVQQAPHVSQEAGAETDKVDLKACLDLRRLFKQRNDRIELTINDILVFYRAIHAATYMPTSKVMEEIQRLSETKPDVAATLRQVVEEGSRTTPAIIVPMDGSLKSPRDRVYPMNVEVPLTELNLLAMHGETLKLLQAYEASTNSDREAFHANFIQMQKNYLSTLSGLGLYFSRAKEMASQGQSYAAGAIKLMAHLPTPIQRMLDKIPEKFEVLNSLIKGREVFSNVGAVADMSTLTRFMTAKDDNNQKQLAWGIITDAKQVMRIHLRDFRPHVAVLHSIGRKDLANLITQDYLDAYVKGLNQYVHELTRITTKSVQKTTQEKKQRDTQRP